MKPYNRRLIFARPHSSALTIFRRQIRQLNSIYYLPTTHPYLLDLYIEGRILYLLHKTLKVNRSIFAINKPYKSLIYTDNLDIMIN